MTTNPTPEPSDAVTQEDRALLEALRPHYVPKWIHGRPAPSTDRGMWHDAPDVDSILNLISAHRLAATKSLTEENAKLREECERLKAQVAKTPRPKKGELRLEMAFSHGDWTEPDRLISYGCSLNVGLREITRDMLREAVATAAARFNDEAQFAFFMVTESEYIRRERRDRAARGVPFKFEEIITKDQTINDLRAQLAAVTRERDEALEDTARMDWLEAGPMLPLAMPEGHEFYPNGRMRITRESIDAARKTDAP